MAKNKKNRVSLISDNTDQYFSMLVRAYEGKNKLDRQHQLLIYRNYLQYYTNFVVIEGDDELKRVWPNLMAHLFWEPYCAITNIGGQIAAVAIREHELGYDGYIKKAKISRFNSWFHWSTFSGSKPDFKDDVNWKEKEIDRTNAAFFKSSIFGIPLFIGLDVYIEPFLKLYSLIPNEIKNAVSKLLLPIPAKQLKNESYLPMLSKMMDKNSGNLIGFVPEDLFEKKIIELKSGQTISEDIISALKYIHNYAYQMTGRIFNVSEKDERNLSQEVSLNTLQFHVVRNDLFNFLEQGVNEYNKVFNRSAKLVLLEDIENRKQAELTKEENREEVCDVERESDANL